MKKECLKLRFQECGRCRDLARKSSGMCLSLSKPIRLKFHAITILLGPTEERLMFLPDLKKNSFFCTSKASLQHTLFG